MHKTNKEVAKAIGVAYSTMSIGSELREERASKVPQATSMTGKQHEFRERKKQVERLIQDQRNMLILKKK